MMLLTCNKSVRKWLCAILCVRVYGLFENINYLSIGNCYWTLSPPPNGMRSFILQEVFSDWTKTTQTYLGLFPLASIMVLGVIVHLLCISVILPSCDDRYIFYKDIHICM